MRKTLMLYKLAVNICKDRCGRSTHWLAILLGRQDGNDNEDNEHNIPAQGFNDQGDVIQFRKHFFAVKNVFQEAAGYDPLT